MRKSIALVAVAGKTALVVAVAIVLGLGLVVGAAVAVVVGVFVSIDRQMARDARHFADMKAEVEDFMAGLDDIRSKADKNFKRDFRAVARIPASGNG